MQKDKQLLPSLRFSEFQFNWESKNLRDLSSLITKGTTPKQFTHKGVNYVKIEGLEGININKSKCLYIDESTHSKELKRSVLKKNDLLFAIAGATIGKVGVVTDDILPANTNQALSIIRLEDNDLLDFIIQVLQSRTMKKYIYQNISIGAQPNLNLEQIGNFRFNIPKLNEQQKIASFLTVIDNRIQTLEKKKALLDLYKKGLIQKIFKQELSFKDEDGNGFVDWGKRRFSDVLFEHKLKSTSKEEVHSVSVHKGVINQIEHLGRSFSAKNTDHYSRALPNDIIYTKSPTGNFPLGIIKQNHIKKDVIISPLYGVFTPETKELGYILHVYFESPMNTSNYLSSIIQKGAKNTINITNNTFLSKKMLLPVSKKEQTKIANLLFAINENIALVTKKIEQTKTYKKGLLQQMFV